MRLGLGRKTVVPPSYRLAPSPQDCVQQYCEMAAADGHALCPYKQQLHVVNKDASEAKGPVWARAIQSNLVDDSEFCMQIDAHMDFTVNWDRDLFRFWGDTRNEYAVLTTYVADYGQVSTQVLSEEGAHATHLPDPSNHRPRHPTTTTARQEHQRIMGGATPLQCGMDQRGPREK